MNWEYNKRCRQDLCFLAVGIATGFLTACFLLILLARSKDSNSLGAFLFFMDIVRWLDRFPWLHTYSRKFLFVAFVAVHVPLLVIIFYLLLLPEAGEPMNFFWLTLVATLLGTGFAFWTLHQLLQPVLLAKQALRAYKTDMTILEVPTDLRDEVGGLLRLIQETVAEIDQQRRQLEISATIDYLTGLSNRRTGTERLSQLLQESRPTSHPLSIALIDNDHFKRLNDTYGHDVGDLVLRDFANVLQNALAPHDGWAARWGGEEFMVLLPRNTREAQHILNEIRLQFYRKGEPDGERPPVTISGGLTAILPGETIDSCLQRADQSLYVAKRTGRNQIRTHADLDAANLSTTCRSATSS